MIEVGAGDGTLARRVLSAMPEDVARSVRYVAVERSPGAREQLTRLAATHGTAATLEVTDRLGDLPPVTGCVLANELLDNLPFHRLRGTGDGAEELYVTLDGDAFVLTPGPLSPDLRRAIGDLEGPDVRVQLPAGQESVVSPAALAFVDAAVRTLDRGYVVLIDYAAEGDQPAGIVHGYPRHHRGCRLRRGGPPRRPGRLPSLGTHHPTRPAPEPGVPRVGRRVARTSGRGRRRAQGHRVHADLLDAQPGHAADRSGRPGLVPGPVRGGGRRAGADRDARANAEGGARPLVIRPDHRRDRRRRTYRSTSPTTKNTLPSTAIRSGIRAPVSNSGIIDTFENDAVRIFRR